MAGHIVNVFTYCQCKVTSPIDRATGPFPRLQLGLDSMKSRRDAYDLSIIFAPCQFHDRALGLENNGRSVADVNATDNL